MPVFLQPEDISDGMATLVAGTCLELHSRGLLTHTRAGNVSVKRLDGPIFITKRGAQLQNLGFSSVQRVCVEGEAPDAGYAPSTELLMHKAVYENHPGTECVIHLHTPFATTLSCFEERSIGPLHYYCALLSDGGSLPVIPFSPPGSRELADDVGILAKTGTHRACLLASHGALAWAPSAPEAVEVMAALEQISEYCVRGWSFSHEPHWIRQEQMPRIREMFKGYFV